jgi:hypothetical protein
MRLLPRGPVIDRAARNRTAGVVASLLDRSLPWSGIHATLGAYHGSDRGVSIIHTELRSVAADASKGFVGADAEQDAQLDAVLRRTERFLRSDTRYRWHDRGPVEIMGAYMGIAALAWIAVAFAGAVFGYGNEAVIAAALFAFALMYIMGVAMAVALLRRLWWRITAQRERADRGAWPFFTAAECRAAGASAGEGAPW